MAEQVESLSVGFKDDVSAGATAAAKSLERVGDAALLTEQRVTRASKSGEALSRQYGEQERLAAKVSAVTNRYARELSDLEAAELSEAKRAELRNAILGRQAVEVQKAAAANERYFAMLRAGANDNLSRGMIAAADAQSAALSKTVADWDAATREREADAAMIIAHEKAMAEAARQTAEAEKAALQKMSAEWDAAVRDREANAAMIIAAQREEAEATRRAAQEAERQVAENARLAASYQQVMAGIDPVVAQQQRYDAALAALRSGAAAASVSVEQLAADEAKLAAAMSPAALAAQKEAAALEALVSRLNPADEAARRTAASQALLDRALAGQIPNVKLSAEQHAVLTQRLQANAAASAAAAQTNARLSGSMTNLSYQLQDAIVQAQMGTNGFIILAQQGSQAASAFGPLGAVIGTVLSIAGAAGKVLFGLGDSANSAASSVELLGRTVAAQGDDVEALTAKWERLTEAQRNMEEIRLFSDLKKSRGELGEAIKELEDAIKDSVPRMLLDFRDIDTPLKPVREILKGIGNGSIDAAEGLIKAETALRQTGLTAGFFDEAVLDAASKVGEMGDKTKLAEAYLAVFSGTATAAQLAMVNYTAAAKNAATAATDLALASGQAAAGLFWQEEDLDRKIAALKGGEAAMKAYSEEQIRATAYKKAFDEAIKADIPILFAEQKANEIATKAVEAHRLELKRADDQKAANAANRKAEGQADRDAKAYQKVSEELDRGIAEQQRLAGVVGQSVEAQREANTETKIAEALAKAHTAASTAEGKAIADKVREQEKWRAAAADAAVLDSSKRQLAYAEKELSLMGQAEPLRDRALKSFQIQQQAGELAKTTTAENVAEWVRLQEAIADTQGIKAFQQEVHGTAKEMSRDVTEALLDRDAKWQDVGRTIGKRLLLGFLENKFVMPVMTTFVGAAPGLFGIQSPANQNAAGQGGMGGMGNYLSLGSKFVPNSWTSSITSPITNAIDSFGIQYLGTGTGAGAAIGGLSGSGMVGLGSVTGGAANAAGVAAVPGGLTNAVAGSGSATAGLGGVGGAGASTGMSLSAGLGAAAGGAAAGSLVGGWLGTQSNSKVVGGLSGAAAGAGVGFLIGGPVGALIGGVGGGLGGMLGTQKATVGPNSRATVDFSGGAFRTGVSASDNGGNEGAVRALTDQIAAALNGIVTAAGLKNAYDLKTIGAVNLMEKDGKYITEVNGQKREFGDQSTAVAGLMNDILQKFIKDGATDFVKKDNPQIVENLRKALDASYGKPAEELVANMQLAAIDFKKAFDEVGKAQPDQIAASITEVATSFVTMRDNAAKLGLSVDGLSATLKGATDRMVDSAIRQANGTGFIDQALTIRSTFEKVGQQLLSTGQDGSKAVQLYGAQIMALVNSFGEDENAVKNLGILADAMHGVDDVAESFALLRKQQVESIIATNKQAEAMKNLTSQADNLTAWLNGQALGDTSSLSPWAKMEEAQRQFDAALSASRKSGDISGATQAADALLSASKPTLVLGTEAYTQREAWITSTLKNLGHELGLPGFKTGGSFEVGGWGGVDSTLVRFMATPGERVTVTRPDQQQAAERTVVVKDNSDVVRALSQVVNVLSAKLDAVTAELSSLKDEKRKGDNLELMRKAS